MTIKESIEQLESLIEAWQLDEADLNQTDIDAIECVLQKRQELIDYLKEEINKINEQIEHFDLWREVGVDINFLILKKQMFKEILSKIESGEK